jgi:hypothetical protein
MISKDNYASVLFLLIRVPPMLSCYAAEILKKLITLLIFVLDLVKLNR